MFWIDLWIDIDLLAIAFENDRSMRPGPVGLNPTLGKAIENDLVWVSVLRVLSTRDDRHFGVDGI